LHLYFIANTTIILGKTHKSTKIEGNSSVFRFEIGQYPQILPHFEQNSEQVKGEVRHEQAYLSREIHRLGKLEYWQDEWVPSFKYRCCPSWIKSWLKAPFMLKMG
jgi:hypothetical protein